jgi:hypothetical protein
MVLQLHRQTVPMTFKAIPIHLNSKRRLIMQSLAKLSNKGNKRPAVQCLHQRHTVILSVLMHVDTNISKGLSYFD